MSNLSDKVHYDQRNDQIKIDGPVTVPAREFMTHLRDEGLRKDSVSQIWSGGDINRGPGSNQQGSNPQGSNQGGERTGRTSG